MTFRTNAISLGLAATLIIGGAAPAAAVGAVASTALNVRSCGSTDCGVVNVLRAGEEIDVRFCEGVWCAIYGGGADGWVNANYLAPGDDVGDDYYDDDFYDDDYVDDDFYIERRRAYPRRFLRRHRGPDFGACVGGPNARFCVYD